MLAGPSKFNYIRNEAELTLAPRSARIGRTPAASQSALETSAAIWKRKRDWKCDMIRSCFLHFLDVSVYVADRMTAGTRAVLSTPVFLLVKIIGR